MVDTERSSRSECATTYSVFSLGDLASRGNGVEVDAEHKPSPDPSESVDRAGLTARRCIPSPGACRLSKYQPKGRRERKHGLEAQSPCPAPAPLRSPRHRWCTSARSESLAVAVTLSVELWTLMEARCGLIVLLRSSIRRRSVLP